MKVLAIIPARGGSKGIPKKNIINFRGKPLIQWTIEAALNSTSISNVIVSSDSDEILQIAENNKGVFTIKRPKELADDSSKTEPVITHVLENLKEEFDYLILLQPTSPLRNSQDIDAAFGKFISSKSDSLISVCELEHHPYKSFKINKNGYLQGIINNDFPFYPRQELPNVFRANGAIYIIKVKEFLKNNSLLTKKTTHFEMDKESSLDIDSIEDLKQ